MTGPLRDFIFKDDKSIIILLGIDGSTPPRDVRLTLQETVNQTINQALIDRGADIEITRETVHLTISKNPTRQQKELVGNALYLQQYDVETDMEEVSQRLVNMVHNTVVDEVEELGFNITGVETKVV